MYVLEPDKLAALGMALVYSKHSVPALIHAAKAMYEEWRDANRKKRALLLIDVAASGFNVIMPPVYLVIHLEVPEA